MKKEEYDPITLEIIQSSLQATADEMFASIRKTAMSSIIYEVLDMGTGIMDAEGEIASSGAGIPAFIGVLDKSVKVILKKFNQPGDIQEGDVFMTNDPYYGGVTHLNDIVVAMPVFSDGKLIAWTADIAHNSDVGGMAPGSLTGDATEIFQEGIRLPAIKAISQGKTIQSVMDILIVNSRMPDTIYGDVWAQIAAVRIGTKRLQELAKKYGADVFEKAMVEFMDFGEKASRVMKKYDLYIDPNRIVGTLSVADQQKVEILRALNTNARLIVFDEPTARLASHQAEQLHSLVRSLAESGTTIIYISHFLEEVLKISDTISLLRNGLKVRTELTSKETKKSLIEGMTGKDAGSLFPKKPKIDPNSDTLLKVKSLTRKNEFHDISFEIKKGEILGIAGLVGSGRSELAHAIYGNSLPDSGSVEFCGKEFIVKDTAKSIDSGMAMVPESRREQGLILERSLLENTSLPYLKKFSSWIYGLNKLQEYDEVDDSCMTTMVKHSGLEKEVRFLSGGNQQKVLFARAAMGKPKLLIADEPTRGVDIGAKQIIYELISQLSKVGEAVLLISSEVEEIIGVAHRALVMSRGQIVVELKGSQITKNAIMEAAFKQE